MDSFVKKTYADVEKFSTRYKKICLTTTVNKVASAVKVCDFEKNNEVISPLKQTNKQLWEYLKEKEKLKKVEFWRLLYP